MGQADRTVEAACRGSVPTCCDAGSESTAPCGASDTGVPTVAEPPLSSVQPAQKPASEPPPEQSSVNSTLLRDALGGSLTVTLGSDLLSELEDSKRAAAANVRDARGGRTEAQERDSARTLDAAHTAGGSASSGSRSRLSV